MAEFLNKNIKYLRTSKKISQQELADKIGIDRSTISRIENNDIETTVDNAIKIANVLGISLDELLGIDLRICNNDSKQTKFHYTDEKTGLSVDIILPDNVDWNSLSKEKQENYINQAMDGLYEAKKEIKNDKKTGEDE